MMVKVLDLCVVDEDQMVDEQDEKELFTYEGGNFKRYIEQVNMCNLDDEVFDQDEIDKSVFVVDDGGELFRTKDGRYYEVCWRGDDCRVWQEDDKDRIAWFDSKLKADSKPIEVK